jgi:nucleotide-binding universal stress UspA family protein
MNPGGAQRPVVVGIDHVGSAADAVEWAAAEAATRACALRVVHAFHPPLPADPYGVGSPFDTLSTARTAAESLLREYAARARRVASDIEVTTRLRCGSTVRTLLDEADRAQLLVLGSRGLHGLRALVARSVSVQVAAHASCPVVVIRPVQVEDTATGTPPRVVVGVDGRSSCSPAIGFAFQAARQRGVPLAAVHAWVPDPPADLEAVHGPPSVAEAIARRTLEQALHRWHSRFPDVPVVTRIVRDDPAHAVAAESRGAALVVVGSRGRGHLVGAVRGSVSRSLLRHAHSPTAVVRDVAAHSRTGRASYGFGARA